MTENVDVLGVRMINQLDISYEHDPECGRVPVGWTIVFRDTQGLTEQYTRTALTERSINRSIQQELFQPSLPVGTWVYDERIKEGYIAGERGNKRPISAAELQAGVTYEDLASTVTGIGIQSRAWRMASSKWFMCLSTIVCLVAFSWLTYHRRNQLRSLLTPSKR
jgi:hypothetical protein